MFFVSGTRLRIIFKTLRYDCFRIIARACVSTLLMESTELSVEFQLAIDWAHRICGALIFSFVFNCINFSGIVSFLFSNFVCLLIVFDSDPRSKSFRKYQLTVQVRTWIWFRISQTFQLLSFATDIALCLYSPIAQINCQIFYADSKLAEFYDIEMSMVLPLWHLK